MTELPSPVLRATDDYEAMVRLAKGSGLEIERIGPVLAAYGFFEGQEMVGCACLEQRYDVYLLECLAVAERYRNRGLGTRLVRTIEGEAKRRGASRLLAVARSPDFLRRVGYKVAEPGEVSYPTLDGCATCPQFEKTCTPAVVIIDL